MTNKTRLKITILLQAKLLESCTIINNLMSKYFINGSSEHENETNFPEETEICKAFTKQNF